MPNNFHGVFWVKHAPTVHTEDGFFHICYESGAAHFEFVMRPSVWKRVRANADRAEKAFNEKQAPVTPLRRRKDA
jgi:hypothetical protein